MQNKKLFSSITDFDKTIYLQVKNGESGACSRLYDLYAAPLFGFILKWVNDKDTATDILQQSFITIIKKCKTDELPKLSLLIWMCRIAINTTQDKTKNEAAVFIDNQVFRSPLIQ